MASLAQFRTKPCSSHSRQKCYMHSPIWGRYGRLSVFSRAFQKNWQAILRIGSESSECECSRWPTVSWLMQLGSRATARLVAQDGSNCQATAILSQVETRTSMLDLRCESDLQAVWSITMPHLAARECLHPKALEVRLTAVSPKRPRNKQDERLCSVTG